jgi:hypothetical protein
MRIGGWRVGFAVSGLLGLAVVCASHEAGGAGAQQQQESDKQYEHLIRSVEGPDLFRAYCASPRERWKGKWAGGCNTEGDCSRPNDNHG